MHINFCTNGALEMRSRVQRLSKLAPRAKKTLTLVEEQSVNDPPNSETSSTIRSPSVDINARVWASVLQAYDFPISISRPQRSRKDRNEKKAQTK